MFPSWAGWLAAGRFTRPRQAPPRHSPDAFTTLTDISKKVLRLVDFLAQTRIMGPAVVYVRRGPGWVRRRGAERNVTKRAMTGSARAAGFVFRRPSPTPSSQLLHPTTPAGARGGRNERTPSRKLLALLDRKRLTSRRRRPNLCLRPGRQAPGLRESFCGRTPEGSLFLWPIADGDRRDMMVGSCLDGGRERTKNGVQRWGCWAHDSWRAMGWGDLTGFPHLLRGWWSPWPSSCQPSRLRIGWGHQL